MKGNGFDMIPGIESATKERLRAFPELLPKLAGRGNKCVDGKGEYFEGK
jgi:hypothetical protein